jgi:predicted phosphoribosyltransferase
MQFEKYESRAKAGVLLTEFIRTEEKQLYHNIVKKSEDYFCFAIPNGGVPVTEGFCSKLGIFYDMLIVRKIKIPYNTEAGFGSVTTDGSVLINQALVSHLNLSKNDIKEAIDITKTEISERLQYYNKVSDLESSYNGKIKGKYIFILDDGLASGFTMLAAIKMILKYNPVKILVAVPTAPLRTMIRIKREVDGIFCPNIREVLSFAVAEAYKHWYDIPESEVLEIIKKSNYYFGETVKI